MGKLAYAKFDTVNPLDFIPVLNEEAIRNHLIHHDLFDTKSIQAWVMDKLECDGLSGCCIRAVYRDDQLVGWCGIQPDGDHYEIAIVLSQSAWGIGSSVFKDMLSWARDLGHKEVVIHLLESRPVYQFLKKMATKTTITSMLGRNFTTYFIPVE